MNKQTLRIQTLEKRSRLSDKEVLISNDLLLIRFQQFQLGDIRSLLTYWPMEEKGEINMHLMADYMLFRLPGLQLAFPVMNMRGRSLTAAAVQDNTAFEQNSYGIMEPVDGLAMDPGEIDAVFVPLLAFDKQGFRVGYGKGFYDRFLATCRTDVLKIGFSFFEAEECIEDVNEFDVPLNICFTPNTIYEF